MNAEEGTADLNTLNFLGVFDLSYDFAGGFFAGGRYTIGITPIFKEEIIIPTQAYNLTMQPEMRTQAFQIGAGYRF